MASAPKSFYSIVEDNRRETHFNYSFEHLNMEIYHPVEIENKNYSVTEEISKTLSRNGQKKFIHLNPEFREANVSIALYSGNGIVSKIIPETYADQLPDITNSGFGRAPFLLPSIKSEDVEGNSPIRGFKVKFYPYVKANDVLQSDIAEYQTKMAEFGLRVKKDDDRPLNFRRLPDKARTVIGIDADMLEIIDMEKFKASAPKIEEWMEYVKKIYPIYETKDIPRQTEETQFDFSGIQAAPGSQFLEMGKTHVEQVEGRRSSIIGKITGMLHL